MITEKITLRTGKAIELPARFYNKSDLKKREIEYVEDKVFFNKATYGKPLPKISDEVMKHMAILQYIDLSNKEFSSIPAYLQALKNCVAQQQKAGADLIIFPASKNERDVLLREKLVLAGEMSQEIEQNIIVEMHYKSEIPHSQLAQLSKPIDFLSVFFGISYGHYLCFKKLIKRICFFKAVTGKKVICMGIPMKFSGDDFKDVRFMPCFDIVSDMWVKSWRGGGGPREIKVIDQNDFECKNHVGWLNSGYKDEDLIIPINHTVAELFAVGNESLREEYESYILDETLRDIAKLNPLTLDGFIGRKFDYKYAKLISTAYREKLIETMFKKASEFQAYSNEARALLEKKIRENHFEPLSVWMIISRMRTTIQQKGVLSVNELMQEVDKLDFNL